MSDLQSDGHAGDIKRLAEASAWRTRLTEAGEESSPAFEAWRDADPANARAWRRVQSAWDIAGEAAHSPEWMAARRDALDRAARRARARWMGWERGRNRALAAGLALLFVLGLSLWGMKIASQPVYRTEFGERRVVTLSDGSRLTLDSATEVRVAFSGESRRIELRRGQARFDVAHDVERPFTVRAGDQTVVATGTAFTVDMMGDRVRVTLIEGRVTVFAAPRRPGTLRALAPSPASTRGDRGSIVLIPGQALIAAPVRPPLVQKANLDAATAWESGQLVFVDERLDAVVERINRYSSRQIRVEGAAAAIRVSGVFNAGDVDAFVEAAVGYFPLTRRTDEDGEIILSMRR